LAKTKKKKKQNLKKTNFIVDQGIRLLLTALLTCIPLILTAIHQDAWMLTFAASMPWSLLILAPFLLIALNLSDLIQCDPLNALTVPIKAAMSVLTFGLLDQMLYDEVDKKYLFNESGKSNLPAASLTHETTIMGKDIKLYPLKKAFSGLLLYLSFMFPVIAKVCIPLVLSYLCYETLLSERVQTQPEPNILNGDKPKTIMGLPLNKALIFSGLLLVLCMICSGMPLAALAAKTLPREIMNVIPLLLILLPTIIVIAANLWNSKKDTEANHQTRNLPNQLAQAATKNVIFGNNLRPQQLQTTAAATAATDAAETAATAATAATATVPTHQ
jgi:hypothetical protein